MSFTSILKIAGTGMSAQTTRLNVTASNMANANSTHGDQNKVYRARQPVFATVMAQSNGVPSLENKGQMGVKVDDIIQDQTPLERRYQPSHPNANKEGYIYKSNVNTIAEMANMIDASRSYQTNIELMNTTKELMMSTINLMNR